MKMIENAAIQYLKKTDTKINAGKIPFDVKVAFWILEHCVPVKENKATREAVTDAEKNLLESIRETTADAFTEDGYIGSQRELSYVPFAKEGNTAEHGCGWVSVYNALRLIGQEEMPETVIHAMAPGARRKGKGGINPFYIYRWLKKKGIRTKVITGSKQMTEEGKKVPAFILCYLYISKENAIGGHFAAGFWQDGFCIYNGEKPGCVVFERIEDACSKNTIFKMMITLEKTEDC